MICRMGYQAEINSAYTDMMENFQTLMLAMLVAVCLVYFILAAQFESFVMPVMVMMILPIALSGALFGLPITGMDLSMIVLLALIMLVGTVVNSSIVLIDYINIRRARGQEKDEAIMEACPLRVRPIMMTTLTTVLALIPMAIGSGEGNRDASAHGSRYDQWYGDFHCGYLAVHSCLLLCAGQFVRADEKTAPDAQST